MALMANFTDVEHAEPDHHSRHGLASTKPLGQLGRPSWSRRVTRRSRPEWPDDQATPYAAEQVIVAAHAYGSHEVA